MKYLTKLRQPLEMKRTNVLPEKFAIIFDGWTKGDSHYLGVFLLPYLMVVWAIRNCCLRFQLLTMKGRKERSNIIHLPVTFYLYTKGHFATLCCWVRTTVTRKRRSWKLMGGGLLVVSAIAFNSQYETLLTNMRNLYYLFVNWWNNYAVISL